ncbi:MAG: phosphatase PAP2 family protein [Methylotenera sp.]|nr:phosphatase PAP2 family protein [Methylotenera sp.]
MQVIFKIAEEITELSLIVASMYLILGFYVQRYQPQWKESLDKRRLMTVLLLVLAVSAIKVSEDVLGGESGSIDTAILVFIHSYVPGSVTWFFNAATYTGSSKVLFPLATIATIVFLSTKYRFEAMLVAASSISGAIVIYFMKMLVSRSRPALWDTAWYWGSSFPSGHTLAVAAFATSLVLCIRRIRPAFQNLALSIAVVWICVVAMSRLVLGVHWPTDVLTAACIGAFIPLAINAVLVFHDAKRIAA